MSLKKGREISRNYDIFLSYRMDDGLDYAISLQDALEERGYSIFRDDENLGNGPFYGGVLNAIEQSLIFIAILTPCYFGSKGGDEDWVLNCLRYALRTSRAIYLVTPDNLFAGFPDNLPNDLMSLISLPLTNISFSALFQQSVNTLELQLRKHISRKEPHTAPIFVSYARDDRDLVFPFVKKIERDLNVNCWLDLEGIESGEQFEDVIIHAIDTSNCILFMLSDKSLQSVWTKREVYYAEGEGKRIVPVVVDGKGLRGWFKFHFGNVDYIDITSAEHYQKLVYNLGSWLSSSLLYRGTTGGHEWVYMGTGVKWAVTNVGAKEPEDSGDFFSWGEMEPKKDYSWATYKFGESREALTKYIPEGRGSYGRNGFTDGKERLEAFDDIVMALWGEPWRTPTKDDVRDLLGVCNRAWIKRNGSSGVLLTSRINGEQLFLPAAGNMNGAIFSDRGSVGRYWTSSVDTDDPCYAWSFLFNQGDIYRIFALRCAGLPIRPVAE